MGFSLSPPQKKKNYNFVNYFKNVIVKNDSCKSFRVKTPTTFTLP